MPELEPITREEMLLDGQDLEPITRKEMFIKRIYDKTQVVPKPITREEMFLNKAGEGGGGDITIEQLNVTQNGTYSESGKAYSPVVVEVPVPTLTTLEVDENGTYTAPSGTAYNEVEVDVPLPENAYLLNDLSGLPADIASFADGTDLPMASLKVAVTPYQDLSHGDPSPSNICPIIGWDEADLSVTGINVWDEEWELGEYNTNTGANYPNNNRIRTKNFVPVLPSTTYYYKCSNASQLLGYDINKNYIGTIPHTSNATFTTQNNCYYIKFSPNTNYGTTYNNDISINYPSTDTSYHAYNGATYTIDLNGTRYGGELDVLNGSDTDDKGYKLFDGSDVTGWRHSGNYGISSRFDCQAIVGKPLGDVISNTFVKGSVGNDKECISLHGTNGFFILEIHTDRLATDDVAGLMGYFANNPLQLVYELATPITVQLSPTQVKSLVGENNISANCGDIIKLEYFSKEV